MLNSVCLVQEINGCIGLSTNIPRQPATERFGRVTWSKLHVRASNHVSVLCLTVAAC